MRSIGDRCGFNAPMPSGRIKDPPAFASYNFGGLLLLSCRRLWGQEHSWSILPGAYQTSAKAKVDTALISWVEKVLRMDFVPAVKREM